MIRIRDLALTYPDANVPAVRGVSLEIAEGAFYTLLGPSGCGKTTTLRCVAGLERPDAGEITIGDETVFSATGGVFVPPHERNIGMVFQSYAIWPHMTVFENIAFPLRYRRPKPSRSEARDRVMAALALVRLDKLAGRPAPNLSGGQQQRLALARALVAEPRVLLLDEPLSNLDAKLREDMRVELRELVRRLRVTTLFVTHEQIEALTMSDVIAVMKDGAIVQEGAPAAIYGQPAESFVADFIGRTNLLSGQVMTPAVSTDGGLGSVATPVGLLHCRLDASRRVGDIVTLAIRPEHIALSLGAADVSDPNVVAGEVANVAYLGNLIECTVAVGSHALRVQLHPSAPVAPGAKVRLALPIEYCLAMRQ
ncbi:MAG TPA: ABC transporter ATP-binding protein [Xanthobacteraceae bacterium]|nr:ABC transporter ATP-binding protein [Xanthobacteraceae bacterium]